MAKRFTDTNKWRKPFVRSLQAPYKLFWFYILDDCDHAGIWIVDMEVAQIRIGEEIKLPEALEIFKNKIKIIDGGERWFISDFIEFQYGQLNPSNRAHSSVINILLKYKLISSKGVISPLQGAKDKDKDKDMVKEKEKGRCLMRNSGVTISDIATAFKNTDDLKLADPKYYHQRALDWSDGDNKMKTDWVAVVRNFARGDIKDGKLKLSKFSTNTGTNRSSDPLPNDYGKPSPNAVPLDPERKKRLFKSIDSIGK